MTITDRPVDNGVNVQALLGAREALSAAPAAAQFAWRATCTWRNGTHSHSTVAAFTGLGTEQQHRGTYEFDVDHPECFASEDRGATPSSTFSSALASCLTAGVAAVAQYRQIQLRSVTSTLEGPDERARHPRGRPRRSQRVQRHRRPLQHRRRRRARPEIEALVAQSQKRSAVFDIVTNPTNVLVELA